MRPAICVLLFLVMCMTNGWCASQKFFPNGRYGRSDPSVPLIEYENNMESLAEEAADNEANGDKQSHKALSDSKLISSLLSRASKEKLNKQSPFFLKGYSESFLVCLIANAAQPGEPIKLICKPTR